MKNSWLILGGVALGGVGVYLYLKGKKSTTTNSTVTTPTTPTDDIKALADLGVKIEEPKVTPYVAPSVPVPTVSLENIQKALLSLNIDQTRGINELASPNYIEAKRIAGNMKEIDKIGKKHYLNTPPYLVDLEVLNALLSGFPMSFVRGRTRMLGFNYNNNGKIETTLDAWAFEKCLSIMTQKINSLGYKVLPNFEIEKM
jgi:hypothetical protein